MCADQPSSSIEEQRRHAGCQAGRDEFRFDGGARVVAFDQLEAPANSQHPRVDRLQVRIVGATKGVLQFAEEDDVAEVEAGELVTDSMDGIQRRVRTVDLAVTNRLDSPVKDVTGVCPEFRASKSDRLDDHLPIVAVVNALGMQIAVEATKIDLLKSSVGLKNSGSTISERDRDGIPPPPHEELAVQEFQGCQRIAASDDVRRRRPDVSRAVTASSLRPGG